MSLHKRQAMRAGQTDTIPYYHELQNAFKQQGCPFCRLLDQAANINIDSMLWAMVNHPDNQETVKQSRGYCHHHGWMLVRSGAALGITILIKTVMDTLLEILETHQNVTSPLDQLKQAIPLRRPNARLVDDLSPQITCPVCTTIEKVAHGYALTFLGSLNQPNSLIKAYRHSDGLCLVHLQRVLQTPVKKKSLRLLLEAQQEIWLRLNDEMAEFIRKNDYRFTHEPVGTEGDSWQRALEIICGAPPRPVGKGGGLTSSLK